MKLKRITLILVIFACIVPITYYGILIIDKLKSKTPISQSNNEKIFSDKVYTNISCTRTTRLENKPVYDRALSFIGEKYLMWDEEYFSNTNSWSFFPSQLVNCIKIEEKNVKNTTGEEGYFIFNDDKIKDNYYPITIDVDYKYNDEAVNALLLVHEITHVQQYLDFLNNKPELSCIDKEVEAFYAQWKFYSFQFPESTKSIDLRIQNDDDLNPQLKIIRDIIKLHTSNIEKMETECLFGPGKSNVEKCVDDIDKSSIKKLLLQNDVYIKQCNL